MSLAQRAYGHAVMRARKSRLLAPGLYAGLVGAANPSLTVAGWRELAESGGAAEVTSDAYAPLASDYAAAIGAYPDAAALLRALARRHEIENVKLLWRAVVRGIAPERWMVSWRFLHEIETLGRERCRSIRTRNGFVDALAPTPYARIGSSVAQAHPDDVSDAELTFDRWTSAEVAAEARALPRSERVATDLALEAVRERDAALVERALGPFGLPPDIALKMTAVLAGEMPVDTLGPPAELRQRIRVRIHEKCRRAFRRDLFGLGPPIALVLLREREVRALLTVAELRARRASPFDAHRALEA